MQVQLSSNSLIIFIILVIISFGSNAEEPVSKSFLTGIAIGGHDSVAYHTRNSHKLKRIVKGNKTWKTVWKGADWLFSSKADRDLFAANPERYSPAYNGFCANALSLGEGLIKTDGTHWQIFGEQLYTYYAERGRERWLSGDYKKYSEEADKAWKDIIGD